MNQRRRVKIDKNGGNYNKLVVAAGCIRPGVDGRTCASDWPSPCYPLRPPTYYVVETGAAAARLHLEAQLGLWRGESDLALDKTYLVLVVRVSTTVSCIYSSTSFLANYEYQL